MADLGEGAISRGPMVPVFEARDVDRAARAVAVLDRAGVPALMADGSMGLMLGRVPDGSSVIVVPLGLRPQARAALEQAGLLAADRVNVLPPATSTSSGAGTGFEIGSSVPSLDVRPTARPPFSVPPTAEPIDEDEGPLEAPPFESTSAQTRFTIALAACSVGALLQVYFLSEGGFELVRRWLALSWDGTQFFGNVITAGLVHGSTLHFLGNLGFGLILGSVLIGTHGLGATAAVWLSASVLGITAEAYLSPRAVVLGASAGIYGLVGLWLRGELQRAGKAVLPRRSRIRALGVILLLAPGALTPITSSGSRVAVLAHLVGFLVGVFAGGFFTRWLGEEDRNRGARRGQLSLIFSTIVTVAGIAAAFLAVE